LRQVGCAVGLPVATVSLYAYSKAGKVTFVPSLNSLFVVHLFYHSGVLVRAQQGLFKGADEVFQQTLIIGNLGKDPEMRYTPDGTPVTSFTVAVNKRWTGRDGSEQDKTTWYRVTCWRKLAETTNQYLKKGKQVMVIGEVEATHRPRGQILGWSR
jgi:hypothetical protein